MKRISAGWLGMFLIFLSVAARAQSDSIKPFEYQIRPLSLDLSFSKTTTLKFPFSILSVDRGSRDVLAQRPKGLNNILQLKAGRRLFTETNLTVITADSKIYDYILHYAENPTALDISYGNSALSTKNEISDQSLSSDQGTIRKDMLSVPNLPSNLHGLKSKKFGIKLVMDGSYVHDGVMYFRLKLQNQSSINYNIDQIRLSIRDEKQVKRTASQELEILPLAIFGNKKMVQAKTEHLIIIAISTLTIPDQKVLSLQLLEQRGGRELSLKISNRNLLHSRQLSR